MEHLELAMVNPELTDSEKVALVILTISGNQSTKQLTAALNKQSQHVTMFMRKLEKAGMVRGYRQQAVAGKRGGSEKFYAIAL